MDIQVKLPEISIRPEALFTLHTPLGDFNFTNSMLFTLIVIAALALFFALATRKMSLAPKGAQNFAEVLVELLLGITEGTAGKRVGRRIFPLIATLFLFIIVANWSGLLPGVGTVGLCVHEANAAAPVAQEQVQSGLPSANAACGVDSRFVPLLRAPNADLNTTLSMALIAIVVVQIAGVAAHGFGGYLKELFTPIPLAPIHLISEVSRIISLSFRLFGNIFGGEVLVTVMYVLLGSLFVGFGTFIFLGLELLFGFIQALLFSILTLVYITTAVAGHSGGGHEPEEAPSQGSAEELGMQIASKLTGQPVPSGKAPAATDAH